MEYISNFSWNAKVTVWIAISDDILRLILESESFDPLLERTRFDVPELLFLILWKSNHFLWHSNQNAINFATTLYQK